LVLRLRRSVFGGGGGLFGSTPAFGASSGGGLFGSTTPSTPAFGASSGGGLFGSTTPSTPAFGASGTIHVVGLSHVPLGWGIRGCSAIGYGFSVSNLSSTHPMRVSQLLV
jgi:hypothetical protein